MKAGDIRSKDEASLKAELTDLKKEQFNLRFQQATGQLANPSRMRDVRRDVARVMTVLGEKTKAKKG
ncbi:MAG TPA: 50S ribosomal protein L29 [Caulobacterales bacterium]|nr:50S ribosomal protein L29 [Caulobacterales bacterium]